MIFQSIFLLLLLVFQNARSNEICTSTNIIVELEMGKIVFFESPNFPQPMTDDDCSINFKLNISSNIKKETKFILAITNPYHIDYLDQIAFKSVFEVEENVTNHLFIPEIDIFQGFALFDDWGEDPCALGSVSSEQPYHFEDDSQILFIRTSYYDKPKSYKNCKWLFTAPEGYGFKIVFVQLNISIAANFIVLNSTQHVITNQNLVKINQAYYNSDNRLQILFFKDHFNYTNIMQAYITIVKNYPIIELIECPATYDGNAITFWNTSKNDSIGYSPNIKCYYNFSVEPGTEVLALFGVAQLQTYLSLENNVDIIKYTDEFGERKLNVDFAFRAYSNNTVKYYNLEFSSDGSIQSKGFQLPFLKIDCKCSLPAFTAFCNGTMIYQLMNVSDVLSHTPAYYCSHLKCNYTILPDVTCMNKLIKLRLVLPNYKQESLDIIKGLTNNITVFDSRNSEVQNILVYFLPTNNNILQVITYPSTFARILDINLNMINPPKIDAIIILSENKPIFAFDAQSLVAEHIISIKAPHTATIAITFNLDEPKAVFDFYNNENLEIQLLLANCFDALKNNEFQCDTKTNEIAMLYKGYVDTTYGYIIFQLANHKLDGCIFTKNVYYLGDTFVVPSIVGIANKIKPCTVYVLSNLEDEPVWISNAWTNSKIDHIKVYAGYNDSKKLVFDFNSNPSNQWKSILFNSRIYEIVIPINTSLKIDYATQPDELPFFNLTGSDKAAVTTSGYGESLLYTISTSLPLAFYNAQTNSLKVTIKDLILNDLWDNYIMANEKIYNITHVGQVMTFNSSIIYFYFKSSRMSYTTLSGYCAHIEIKIYTKN